MLIVNQHLDSSLKCCIDGLSPPGHGVTAGHTLIFYDITELVTVDDPAVLKPQTKRQLHKIPTVSQNSITLVDVESVTFIRAEGHYTWVSTAQGSSFCNLNISDIADRLHGASFMRIHRSYLANLDYAERILREEGKVGLKLRGESTVLPVARASVHPLMDRLGITETDVARD